MPGSSSWLKSRFKKREKEELRRHSFKKGFAPLIFVLLTIIVLASQPTTSSLNTDSSKYECRDNTDWEYYCTYTDLGNQPNCPDCGLYWSCTNCQFTPYIGCETETKRCPVCGYQDGKCSGDAENPGFNNNKLNCKYGMRVDCADECESGIMDADNKCIDCNTHFDCGASCDKGALKGQYSCSPTKRCVERSVLTIEQCNDACCDEFDRCGKGEKSLFDDAGHFYDYSCTGSGSLALCTGPRSYVSCSDKCCGEYYDGYNREFRPLCSGDTCYVGTCKADNECAANQYCSPSLEECFCNTGYSNCDGDFGGTGCEFYGSCPGGAGVPVPSDSCVDNDGDGFGDPDSSSSLNACTAGSAADCNDDNPNVNMMFSEVCDGIDNNCDGSIDEGCDDDDDDYCDSRMYYQYSSPSSCSGGTYCCPKSSSSTGQGDDCNDNDATVYPKAWALDSGKKNCCDSGSKCVNSAGNCVAHGTYDFGYQCSNGAWFDCGANSNRNCCVGSGWEWIFDGEAAFVIGDVWNSGFEPGSPSIDSTYKIGSITLPSEVVSTRPPGLFSSEHGEKVLLFDTTDNARNNVFDAAQVSFSPARQTVTVKLDIYFENMYPWLSGLYPAVQLYRQDTKIVEIKFITDKNQINLQERTVSYSLQSGKWYAVEIIADLEKSEAQLKINGNTLLFSVPIGSAEKINRILIMTYPGTDFYVDNVVIRGNTLPFTCVGNDANEYVRYRQCAANACTTDTSDRAGCDRTADCVFEGVCFTDADDAAALLEAEYAAVCTGKSTENQCKKDSKCEWDVSACQIDFVGTFLPHYSCEGGGSPCRSINVVRSDIKSSHYQSQVYYNVGGDSKKEVCDPGTWYPPETELYGYVTNITGNYLEEAKVDVIGEEPVYTDANGYYSIVIGGGNYDVVVSKPQYATTTTSIEVSGPTKKDFVLEKPSLGSCEDDCTYAYDDICHAECNGIGKCSFYDSTTASLCDNQQKYFSKQYDETNIVTCCDGIPHKQLKVKATTKIDAKNIVRIVKNVWYEGKKIKMIIDVFD